MPKSNQYISISDSRHIRKESLFWLLQTTGWLIFGATMRLTILKTQINNWSNFWGTVVTFSSGFIISTLIRYIYRFFRYKIKSIVSLSITIITVSLLFSFIWLNVDNLISYPIHKPEANFSNFWQALTFQKLITATMFYTLMLLPWSVLYFFINFWIDWTTQKKQAENNKLLFQEARLMMLRYQLNPHFFFNALSSIDVLIDENKEVAKNLIYKLSDFLRYSFLSDQRLNASLQDELLMIEKYFDIEKIRFEDDIEFEMDIDPASKDLIVPVFILQALVENSIKHGMKTTKLPLIIKLRTKCSSDKLLIQVENSGQWVGEEFNNDEVDYNTGVGLKNVIHRLRNEYGSDFEFKVEHDEQFVKIIIIINSKKIYGNQ